MIYNTLNNIDSVIGFDEVSAHCDIPCKIYDPTNAMHAALSSVRMIDLMEELHAKNDTSLQAMNTMSRYVAEKENQASICKKEIRIIWGDFYKEPQFTKYPHLHELTHSIMMAASKVKQEPSRAAGEKLVSLLNDFSEIFWEIKGVKTKKAVCPYPPSLEVVYPEL